MDKRYDFDQIIERKGSNDMKHEFMPLIWHRDDLSPMWVADMDFASPDFILDALKKRLEHPILGYTSFPKGYWETIAKWIADHHSWQTQPDWYRFISGIVKGIGYVLNVFTKPGDKVIIQSPVYHPFHLVPEGNQLKVVNNPLRMNPDGRYEMDFEQLEECYDEQCKVFILCNPHNPGGRCWDHATLKRLADFCYSHHMVVISDEIHCDMAIFGNKHIPFAHVSQEAAEISITFGAPSKTFNIAGLVSSYAIVPNEQLRKKFFGWLDGNTISEGNIFSPIATMAAYEQGETWCRQMLAYVEENILAVEAFCERYMPQIRPIRPEASFLIWLDCRALGLDHDQLQQLFVDKARLALNDGEMFGPGGEGFMRMNVGSPRAYILQCLEQLKTAVESLEK